MDPSEGLWYSFFPRTVLFVRSVMVVCRMRLSLVTRLILTYILLLREGIVDDEDSDGRSRWPVANASLPTVVSECIDIRPFRRFRPTIFRRVFPAALVDVVAVVPLFLWS